MIKKSSTLFLLLLFIPYIYSQDIKINKIEPPNWWAGMESNVIQLMVYGENLSGVKASFNHEGLKVLKVHDVESGTPGTYTFIDVEIDSLLEPGDYSLILSNDNKSVKETYSILKREGDKNRRGFNPEDIIYLIMPDRFANGDVKNDTVASYINSVDRSKGIARHGGDIQGIIDHLDYIKETGYTAIWLNPVIENNTQVSYHGYGATDFYKVDPRLGTNELYKKLVDEAHKRGIKIILDHVANHIHINHAWMKNLPLKEWINGSTKNFHITNHDKLAIVDVHGDKSTLENSTRGWFTDYMPDLNTDNPFMANYVIQNTIWWMEYAGIDAIREDTYPYADPVFMSKWAKVILEEYPNSNIVGEVWKGDPVVLATYQQKSMFTPGFDTFLPCVTDFALSDALRGYLEGNRSINSIYENLGMDFAYHDPYNLLTFIDNHDVRRAMYFAKENVKKVKTALQILLTTRGIPQLFYGFEIAQVGGSDDGSIRTDFPGGFPGDASNAFTMQGRTPVENDMYDFTKKMIEIRKENKALSNGKLVHFPPKERTYIYFRVLDNEKVMVIVNDNDKDKEVDLTPVLSMLEGAKELKELKSGKAISFNGKSVLVPAGDVGIYKIR